MSEVHSGPSEELEEFAASFALGSLDADERSEFAVHLRSCGVCYGLVAEFGEAADGLYETLDPVETTPGLKGRVMDAAAAEAGQPDLEVAAEAPVASPPGPRGGWFSSIFGGRYQAAAAAVLLVVIGALVAWNIVLQTDDSDDPVQEAFAAADHLYNLEGTDLAPGTSGAVYWASETVGFLLLHNLPETGPHEVYQAWRIKGSTPLPEDTFRVSSTGSTIVAIDADVADADTIAITVEPDGGVQEPTGAPLLIKAS